MILFTIFKWFELTKILKKSVVSKDAQYSETDFWVHEFFLVRFLVFELWSILYFTFVVHSRIIEEFRKKDPAALGNQGFESRVEVNARLEPQQLMQG